MKDVLIRFWKPTDIPDLRDIFTASFGDPPEIAASFHRIFLTGPEVCMLAAVPEEGRPEGRPVAAVYCLPGPELRMRSHRISSVYLYAFGCLPEWRGQGITKQVYTAAFREAGRRAPASCLIPASDSLMQAYNRTGCTFVPLGRMRFAKVAGDEATEAGALPAERLSWHEYACRREECLEPYPHAVYPDSYYSLSAEYGYAFLSLPGALATVIQAEDRLIVSELLCTDADPARALAGVAAVCPAEVYEVCTPAFLPGPGELRPFAYVHTETGIITETEEFWYPFGLE